jgi:hypothetical protein
MSRLESFFNSIASLWLTSSKLGHPVPESNLVSEEKSSAPHAAHVYIPDSFVWTYSPEKGASGAVPKLSHKWEFF